MDNFGRVGVGRVLWGALLVLGVQVVACSDAPSESDNTPGAGGAGAGGSSAGGSGGAGQGGGTAGSSGASAGSGGSGAGTGGSAGSAGECKADAECEAKLPEVNPPGCAEARCEGGTCVFRAKDKDGDGQAAKFCKDPSQTVEIEVGKDCDDSDKTRYPGAWDGPAGDGNAASCDGVDNDCSGAPDDSVLADGTSCECKPGAVASCSEDSGGKKITWPLGEPAGECKHGSRTCTIDGLTGLGKWGPCTGAVPPSSEECNGKDDDCDGKTDDEDDDTKGQIEWLCDADNDGEAAANAAPRKGCLPPPIEECNPTPGANSTWGIKLPKTDCNDGRADVNQKSPEVCDSPTGGESFDENCNGQINEGCSCENGQSQSCFTDPGGQLIPSVNGAAVGACKAGTQTCVGGQWGPCLGGVGPKLEVCANASVLDDDCDGELDDELDKLEWFCDGDSDGFAAIGASPVKSCAPPLGGCEGPNPVWGLNLPTTDCQDSNVAINPNALEICDEGQVDNNCNGLANEGCSCANGKTQACFQDFSGAAIPSVNGAAVGACKAGTQTCYSGQWGPCVGGLGPQAETCGNLGADNDCDGDSAEADDKPTYYCDADNDGFLSVNQAAVKTAQQCGGPPAPGTLGCAGTWRPLGTPFLDCNDGAFNINPNGTEICDASQVDENCNGQKNEGCSCQNGQTQACFVTAQGAIIPSNNGVPIGECKAGTQTCAGGQWGSCTGGVGPAPETCANIGKDNDCDGDTTDADDKSTYHCDPDNDGFLDKNKAPLSILVCGGAPAAGSNGCAGAWRPQGTPFTDCGEGNPAINPNGVEVCDATLLDENCNGQINEGCSCINGTTTDCGSQATCNFVQNGAVCKSGVYDLAAVCKTPRAKQNFCPDLDSDGYCGTLSNCLDYCPAGTLPSEGPLPPSNWKLKTSCVGVGENKVDCNDNQSSINPGATELCGDGIDSNCASGDSDGYNVGAACNVGGLSVGACSGGGANACSAPGSTQTVCNASHPDIGKAKAQTFQAPNGSWDWSCDGNVTTSASVNKTSCGGGICYCPQTITNFTYPALLAACKNGSNLQPGDISGAPFVNRVCGPNLNNLDSICQGLGNASCGDTIVYIDTMCGGACGSASPSCGKTIAAVRCTNTSGTCKSTNYQGGICNTPYETFVMACQ